MPGIGRAFPDLSTLDVRHDHVGHRDIGADELTAGAGARQRIRQFLIVILRILNDAQPNLFQIALATRPTCVFACPREDRKQDGREDRYNGDDDQKFDERERFAALRLDVSCTCFLLCF